MGHEYSVSAHEWLYLMEPLHLAFRIQIAAEPAVAHEHQSIQLEFPEMDVVKVSATIEPCPVVVARDNEDRLPCPT
jgi:hypothetical protein